MDEVEYRSAYKEINPTRCVYEKAINSRVCNCSCAKRFNLADREGVSCHSQGAQQRCQQLMQTLRDKARFVLQQTNVAGQLPHNAEIKIQNGGIQGLLSLLEDDSISEQDIATVLQVAINKYASIELLPYSNIMQKIAAYQGRSRRQRKK